MVQRHWRGDVGLGSEDDQADAVVRTLIDEALENFARHIEPINRFAAHFEIFRDHAAGHVERHHNINSTGIDLGLATGQARLRERDDKQRQREPSQRR